MTAPPPRRLKLSRAKGFNLQRLSKRLNGRGAVTVARPGRWGNPFPVTPDFSPDGAVARFHAALLAGELGYGVGDVVAGLRGRNLACWCAPDAPCHGDVLLEIANA